MKSQAKILKQLYCVTVTLKTVTLLYIIARKMFMVETLIMTSNLLQGKTLWP